MVDLQASAERTVVMLKTMEMLIIMWLLALLPLAAAATTLGAALGADAECAVVSDLFAAPSTTIGPARARWRRAIRET